MELIAKHLNPENLLLVRHQVETRDAFTGELIREGIALSDVLSDVFTDWAYVKYPTGYVSVSTALCIAEVIRTGRSDKRGNAIANSLRSYSYYASGSELRLLAREECLDLLLAIPETPFHVAITYSNKKHTAFKTTRNTSRDYFIVTTDTGDVVFEKEKVLLFLPIIQAWYSVVPGKETTSLRPTFFTKEEILSGNAGYHKQSPYGLRRFEQENEFLYQFRNTSLFKLVVHLLNKK